MEYENKLNTFLSNPKNISYTLDFTRDQKLGIQILDVLDIITQLKQERSLLNRKNLI